MPPQPSAAFCWRGAAAMHLWRPSDRGSTAQPSFISIRALRLPESRVPFPLSLLQLLGVHGQAHSDEMGPGRAPSQIHHITSHCIASHWLPA